MALSPEMYDVTTDAAFFVLLTITSADGSDVSRLVNNNEPVTSRGEVFEPYPFSIVMPIDDPDQQPQATLNIDNVDLRIIRRHGKVRVICKNPRHKQRQG